MKINLKKIKEVELEGINTNDWPDFSDAFITKAEYEGRDMTEKEIEHVNDNYTDFVHDQVIDFLF